jgi:hypothetical protein
MLLLDANILIDVLRGEAAALAWLERQRQARISVITWNEVLVGCRTGDFPLELGASCTPTGSEQLPVLRLEDLDAGLEA